MSKWSEWRTRRRDAKRWKRWEKQRNALQWGEDVSGTNFNPKTDSHAADAVDTDDVVQVIPTYYEYDDSGEATGEVKS